MTQLTAWLNKPFAGQMTAFDWFLFTGLLVVSLYMWHTILRDVSKINGDL